MLESPCPFVFHAVSLYALVLQFKTQKIAKPQIQQIRPEPKPTGDTKYGGMMNRCQNKNEQGTSVR